MKLKISNPNEHETRERPAEIEAVEQIHRLIKKGPFVESAVAVVAQQSKYSESILHTKYDEYKDALTEIEQIFTKPKTNDPE